MENFFKNDAFFRPRADDSFHRLQIQLATLRLNSKSLYKTIIEKDFADLLFLRKTYTPQEYAQTLLKFRELIMLELTNPYYFTTKAGHAEHRLLHSNIICGIDGLLNKSKVKWYD